MSQSNVWNKETLMTKLIEGKDFIVTKNGDMIFSREFLLNKGKCCHSGCVNCPYEANHSPDIPPEFLLTGFENDDQGSDELYLGDEDLSNNL